MESNSQQCDSQSLATFCIVLDQKDANRAFFSHTVVRFTQCHVTMEASQLNAQPSSGSDAWMAGLPTSHQTSSLFQKVMAQRSVQIEAAQAAKEVRRAIQRPKGLTFMKVGKPAEAGTLKGFAKEIGVSYQGNKETVLARIEKKLAESAKEFGESQLEGDTAIADPADRARVRKAGKLGPNQTAATAAASGESQSKKKVTFWRVWAFV